MTTHPLILILILILAAAGVGIYLLISKRKSSSPTHTIQPDEVYLKPDGWVISWSPNMPTHPTAEGKGWYFDFPDKDGVHMILVPYNAKRPHKLLSITYKITALSGSPKFVSVDAPGGGPAIRPMLERAGDTMSASQEFYRWWSSPKLLIADGIVQAANYPLTYDKWTGVFGKSDAGEFATTWNGNLMAVGMSFGGAFAAHGVYATGGKARFTLLDYTII